MHRLASAFVLGYHGCDRRVGERLLQGDAFHPSNNEYDWLGSGIYFWEANPSRALDFAGEASRRRPDEIHEPFVIGAVIELGLCLDLTTTSGVDWIRIAFRSLTSVLSAGGRPLPENSSDRFRRPLDCAVILRLHGIFEAEGLSPVDTVRGVFTEGPPVYPGAGVNEKTHSQIAVRNPRCIKGVFRVRPED